MCLSTQKKHFKQCTSLARWKVCSVWTILHSKQPCYSGANWHLNFSQTTSKRCSRSTTTLSWSNWTRMAPDVSEVQSKSPSPWGLWPITVHRSRLVSSETSCKSSRRKQKLRDAHRCHWCLLRASFTLVTELKSKSWPQTMTDLSRKAFLCIAGEVLAFRRNQTSLYRPFLSLVSPNLKSSESAL